MGQEKCRLSKESCWHLNEEDGTMAEVVGAKDKSDETTVVSSNSRTNRDWLFSLSDKELAEFLCGEDFQRLKLMWNSSVRGIEQWLSEEYNEGKKAYERM